jgi:hypothetical protein
MATHFFFYAVAGSHVYNSALAFRAPISLLQAFIITRMSWSSPMISDFNRRDRLSEGAIASLLRVWVRRPIRTIGCSLHAFKALLAGVAVSILHTGVESICRMFLRCFVHRMVM